MSSPGAEFVLTEQHPAYRAPQTGELFCCNRGTLLISGVTKSVWAAQGARPAHDANNEIDFGHIDALSRVGLGLGQLTPHTRAN